MIILPNNSSLIEVAAIIAQKNNAPSLKTDAGFDQGFFRDAIVAQSDSVEDESNVALSASTVALSSD